MRFSFVGGGVNEQQLVGSGMSDQHGWFVGDPAVYLNQGVDVASQHPTLRAVKFYTAINAEHFDKWLVLQKYLIYTMSPQNLHV